MDDGSRSGCRENVADEKACQALRATGDWNRCHFIAANEGERCACEDESGKPGGNLPVKYEQDFGDLDEDGDRNEKIRWRYVVVVYSCKIAGKKCRERNHLNRGWTNEAYS